MTREPTLPSGMQRYRDIGSDVIIEPGEWDAEGTRSGPFFFILLFLMAVPNILQFCSSSTHSLPKQLHVHCAEWVLVGGGVGQRLSMWVQRLGSAESNV